MAEALALFASVLTIATLIKEIVKRAKTICRASEEFRILQEQVEDFGILVRKMTDQQAKIDDQATETALHRATQTLGQLDNIIKNDLLREHNSTIRVGRRAWARNRSMVLRLQDTLKENRLSLLAAMSANNMSSSKKSSAIASNQDRRLVGIQHIVSTTHQAILSQSTAIDSILQILSGGRSDPAGPLERSPSFFPEAYTNVNRLPMSGLIVIHSYQKEMFKDCMTNSYDIFLIKSSRRWYRISTTVHIYRSSVYWTATQLSSQERIYADAHGKMAGSAVLPYSLQSRIQLLLTAEELDRVARFNLSLSDGREIQISRSECHLPSAKTLTELSNSVVAAWGFIDDLGCARYSENEVIRVQVLRAPFQFLSCLNGRAVVEHVFDSPGPNGQMIYNIRVLHCMKGNDFFAQLAGVVVDHKSMRMKSVLIEYSQATRSLEQMAQLQGVPWAKRERWARQLVEGVSQLHHNGFVAGTLYCCESPVVIDATEKLQFRCLKSKFNMGRTRGDWYPPEFRYLQTRSTDTREADCPDVTSKADIFKLGAVLWLLAENPSRMSNSPSCIRAQCAGQSRICNQQSHFSTIDLPPLPDDVPLYYREMIGACRAREPNDRPAARVLLKMFPSSYSAPILEHVLHPNTGFDSMPENLVGMGYCNYCQVRPLPLPFFHCNVCIRGNFDMCQRCYDQKYHCYEESHLLVEMIGRNGMVIPGRYFSSVDNTGSRNIIQL